MICDAQDQMERTAWLLSRPSYRLAEIRSNPAIKAPLAQCPDANKPGSKQNRNARKQGKQIELRVHQTCFPCADIRIVRTHVPLCCPESQRQNPTRNATFRLVNIAASRIGFGNLTWEGRKGTSNESR